MNICSCVHYFFGGVTMIFTDIISLLLFFIFAAAYILKLVLLKTRSKINANVMSKGNKAFSIQIVEVSVSISSFLWLLTWLSEIIFHKQISSTLSFFLHNIYTSHIGLVVTAIEISIFILAFIFMKSSWRVGIDKNTKTFYFINTYFVRRVSHEELW